MRLACRADLGLFDGSFVNGTFQILNSTSHMFQLRVLVCGNGCIALLLQFLDLCFDLHLVDADDVVMSMHFQTERCAYCLKQMLLVHLRESLDRVVVDSLRNISKFSH